MSKTAKKQSQKLEQAVAEAVANAEARNEIFVIRPNLKTLSRDEAIDRMAEIGSVQKAVKREKDGHGDLTKEWMIEEDESSYTTPNGNKATVYEQEKAQVDKEYAKKVLSKKDYQKIFESKKSVSVCLRVTKQ